MVLRRAPMVLRRRDSQVSARVNATTFFHLVPLRLGESFSWKRRFHHFQETTPRAQSAATSRRVDAPTKYTSPPTWPETCGGSSVNPAGNTSVSSVPDAKLGTVLPLPNTFGTAIAVPQRLDSECGSLLLQCVYERIHSLSEAPAMLPLQN